MFFDSIDEIKKIASRVGCAIFVMPNDARFEIKNAIILQPEEKASITIEQVRNVIQRLSVKQTSEQFIIIRPADLLSEEAANAFLKNLEEPSEKIHFVLITDRPSCLLPTILSRAEIYFLRGSNTIDDEIKADNKVKDLAKRLIVAKPADLPNLAEEICKKKDGVRAYALEIIATAIKMLYKSYFLTQREVFVRKLPRFLNVYENIEKNGHVRLHLIADLI